MFFDIRRNEDSVTDRFCTNGDSFGVCVNMKRFVICTIFHANTIAIVADTRNGWKKGFIAYIGVCVCSVHLISAKFTIDSLNVICIVINGKNIVFVNSYFLFQLKIPVPSLYR